MADREGWVLVEMVAKVDDGGDYGVGRDEDEAVKGYEDDIGGTGASRFVKVAVWVELPKTATLNGEAPLVGQGAELTIG